MQKRPLESCLQAPYYSVCCLFFWGLFELAAEEEKWLHWTGTNGDILGKVILGAATCDLKPQGPLAI